MQRTMQVWRDADDDSVRARVAGEHAVVVGVHCAALPLLSMRAAAQLPHALLCQIYRHRNANTRGIAHTNCKPVQLQCMTARIRAQIRVDDVGELQVGHLLEPGRVIPWAFLGAKIDAPCTCSTEQTARAPCSQRLLQQRPWLPWASRPSTQPRIRAELGVAKGKVQMQQSMH
jgi:hypothetical protein